MTKQTINRGSAANDGTGDNLRAGAAKVNENFSELYTVLGDGTTLLSGNYITDASTSVLTNKSISGSTNTLTNIPSSALSSLPNTKLDNSAITVTGDTGSHAVDLGDTLTVEGSNGIATTITADKISIAIDGTVLTETSTDTLTNKTISGSTNTLSSIANSSLLNSTVSYGGISLALGATDATPAFDLADATNYPTSSLSGTITNAQLTGSITNDKLVNNTITIGDDTSTNFNVGLGGSFEIIGGAGLSTAIDNNRITLTVGNIPNASLDNNRITIGNSIVNLGATLSTASNFSLTGTSSISGTGTADLTGTGSKMRFDFAGYGSLPAAATYVGMYAYDSTGNRPYYSSGSGWVRVLDENSSVSVHTDVNISGVADGHVLSWSSAQGRFNVGSPAGGGDVVTDTTPQLGGNLDGQAFNITTTGKILYSNVYSLFGDLPSASTYHGMFAHVHGTGKGYFAHAGAWTKLVDETSTLNDLSGVTVTSPVAGDSLVYNGSAWAQVQTPVSQLLVTSNGSSAYRFTGAGFPSTSGDNPTLFLKKGQTYYFINNSGGGHPFEIRSSAGGSAYNTGVTNNNGSSGAIIFHISMDTPGTLYYQCSNHSGMLGTITIT